jgi:hypothetical protein
MNVRCEKMTCKNEKCEYKPTFKPQPITRSPEEIRYGLLWAEIELPKLLRGEKQ